MKPGTDQASHASLTEVQRRFERWRGHRAVGTRIPEELWQAAVEVGCTHGASKTSRALGLDYYKLKTRLESLPNEAIKDI